MTEAGDTTYNVTVQFNQTGLFPAIITCSKEYYDTTNYSLTAINVTDQSPPQWINNTTSPASGVLYAPGATYYFNVTWSDNIAVDTVFIEHNFTGITANFSMFNVSSPVNSIYIYNLSDIAAGNYSWKSYANDTSGNSNSTDSFSYIINQAGSNLTIAASPSFSVINGTQTNVSCSASNSQVNFSLYRNATLINSSFGGIVSDVQNLTSGTYNYTCNATGSQNYTAASTSTALIVTLFFDNPPNVSLTNISDAYVRTSSALTNISFACSAVDDYALVNLSLYLTNTSNQSFVFNQTTEVSGANNSTSWEMALAEGNYTWNCLAFDNSSQSAFSQKNDSFQISLDTDGDNVSDKLDTLEGNLADVVTSGITSLNISIGGKKLNGTFSGKQEVIIYDGATILVNFTHNFSASRIRLNKISIRKTTTSLVVNLSNQLSVGENKTLYLTDNSFVNLCVKDAEISTAAEISSSCTAANETDFSSCLGVSSGTTINNLTCYDLGSRIRITDLIHSGIKGTQAAAAEEIPAVAITQTLAGGSCPLGRILVAGRCITPQPEELPEPAEEALFDIILAIADGFEEITPNQREILLIIDLFKFGAPEQPTLVQLRYQVYTDLDVLVEEVEEQQVYRSSSFFKTLSLPELVPGEYNVKVHMTYDSKTAEAIASFSVAEPPSKFSIFPILGVFRIIILVAGILIFMRYWKRRKLRKKIFLKKSKHISEEKQTYF